ncbi:SprT family zinc-dependent metalloprotease [Micromonospora haikouensis]|uniref:SprT family zinc-dependent metalloprotease n=1 Tax=Micromonospora haikouensis TaxID=686309 RepID=UPI0011875B79|nr:SprT family zinc-dependent metalloprotease [Micromonospora haikouensis]
MTAEIIVSFDGSHLDLTRLRGGGGDCATDLATIYTELYNRLRDHSIFFHPPANNTVTWAEQVTGPDGEEALGGWDPHTRHFVLHRDLALVPELVRDVVAHEMIHQIISDYPGPSDHDHDGHGDRFYKVAQTVAQALDMPTPNHATVAVWPTLDRPRGYYGPLVAYRDAHPAKGDMTAKAFIAGIPDALTPEALSRAVEASRLRKPGVTSMPDSARPTFLTARADAKRAVLADRDLKTAGTDAIWAAVLAAMDAAGAYAARDSIDPGDFTALLAPWSCMTEGETK